MKPVRTFVVTPSLPQNLSRLQDLAYNLRWSWNHDTIDLFRRLDNDLWEKTGHNPVLMLGTIEQARLEAAAVDQGFLAELNRVAADLDEYLNAKSTWFSQLIAGKEPPLIAYFSAEFGVTECLSIFAGGLGVLAGDHLKSSSDLGLPLVGVGLLYQEGYFSQYLNESGWQQESYKDNDFYNLPISLVRDPAGNSVRVKVPHPGREVIAQIWRAQVGRVPLYLLDTNISENSNEDRAITNQLYGGNEEMRIRQEMVLGIGGYRALKAINLSPTVFHMNEGHSAFLALERTFRYMLDYKFNFAEARQAALPGLVFTTHTPVAAGHDYFQSDLIERYLGDYIRDMGLTIYDFMALGRKDPDNDQEPFCMTILALKMAAFSNGVSRLHGEVTREMWQDLYPGVPVDEIPITYITNGIHYQTWISREMKELYDRYLGLRWREDLADQEIWNQAERISSEELWRTHERRRERLVAYSRQKLRQQLIRRGSSQATVQAADDVLDSEILTIGFGRRFATYKRAALILKDPDRLDRILNHPKHPVQIIFAGKAHPRDDPGKQLIRDIFNLARQDRFSRRIVFLEDYDMSVARYMVEGCDIWLNTPLRPREASGTSGMKAAANGVLNLSILDGWWDEGYAPEIGWAIGRRESYQDPNYQDQVEAEALYGLLEGEIVPMFYDRGAGGLPHEWINRVKASIKTLCQFFNTHRMVGEYTERFYLQVSEQSRKFTSDNMQKAIALAAWKTKVTANWSQLKVLEFTVQDCDGLKVGDAFKVFVRLQLGNLEPSDVAVEIYMGPVSPDGDLTKSAVQLLELAGRNPQGDYVYQAQQVPCGQSGLIGCTVRVLPNHPDLVSRFLPGLILWARPPL
ncbi:MAG TPA: alpha-glucan family phosphorylase [Anaerolineaceae bacterium]|nr:alpha-glucan family phosphorylase [Anaerolineaceae bacterium]